ncbi:hypothetical protein C2845_PM10G13110 [Panicum miliaceum]|uniref:Uncharacterized protein n=1 Tax=Panicum miliaceum TaxID=4540 RepID=A0A3L6PEE1_PANMI|nr:hypothetical protein C2845_PM10G13110 [Panicum miliaceum]
MSKQPGGRRGERDGRNCLWVTAAASPLLMASSPWPEATDTALPFRPPVIRQQLLQVN